MNNYTAVLLSILVLVILITSCMSEMDIKGIRNDLQVHFEGDKAQIEVGGPYVGIEMHQSAPSVNRISFFYPAANSIDMSADYWKRENYRIMGLGLKVGDGSKRWIGIEPFDFTLTPYRVLFKKAESDFFMTVDYQFCKNKPAFIATFQITNTSSEKKSFEFFTHLELSLRTCHSYKMKDSAWTEVDPVNAAVYADGQMAGAAAGIRSLFAGLAGGLVGSGAMALGIGLLPAGPRKAAPWLPMLVTGTVCGGLLALDTWLGLDRTSFLYPVWQSAVGVRLAMALRR